MLNSNNMVAQLYGSSSQTNLNGSVGSPAASHAHDPGSNPMHHVFWGTGFSFVEAQPHLSLLVV